jgi:hypothetical protein
LREARTAFASGVPSAAATTYDRPDSLRGKAPPRYSLYVLRTSTRGAAAPAADVATDLATERAGGTGSPSG